MLSLTENIVLRMLSRIWLQLGSLRRTQFKFIFVLTVITAGTEVLTLGTLIPFIGALVSPESLFEHPSIKTIAIFFGYTTPNSLVTFATITFLLAIILAATLRVLQFWATARVSFGCGSEFAEKLFKIILQKSYQEHLSFNSSAVISAIGKVDVVVNSLSQMVRLVSSLILTFTILCMLLFIDAKVAIASFIFFGGAYAVISWSVKFTLQKNSRLIAMHKTKSIKLLQDGLGGIRDILMNGNSLFFLNSFKVIDKNLRRSEGTNSIIEATPRFLMEAIGMTFVALLAFFLFLKNGNIENSLPLLGVLALSAQRMLPALQQAYNAWTSIKGHQISVNEVLDIIEDGAKISLPPVLSGPVSFTSSLQLRNINFRYKEASTPALKNVNLSIYRGQKIGIVGATGSGKSTLIDLILGLLEPTEGQFFIDSVGFNNLCHDAWKKNIAHVPQEIFLTDGTIVENIAFGVKKHDIDESMVIKAAKMACVMDFAEKMPLQLHTMIGERGLLLSGGERQRIGIARALYKNAELIIFDESTSALDKKTERRIMKTMHISMSQKTFFIITHRPSLLQNCDVIISVENGIISTDKFYNSNQRFETDTLK